MGWRRLEAHPDLGYTWEDGDIWCVAGGCFPGPARATLQTSKTEPYAVGPKQIGDSQVANAFVTAQDTVRFAPAELGLTTNDSYFVVVGYKNAGSSEGAGQPRLGMWYGNPTTSRDVLRTIEQSPGEGPGYHVNQPDYSKTRPYAFGDALDSPTFFGLHDMRGVSNFFAAMVIDDPNVPIGIRAWHTADVGGRLWIDQIYFVRFNGTAAFLFAGQGDNQAWNDTGFEQTTPETSDDRATLLLVANESAGGSYKTAGGAFPQSHTFLSGSGMGTRPDGNVVKDVQVANEQTAAVTEEGVADYVGYGASFYNERKWACVARARVANSRARLGFKTRDDHLGIVTMDATPAKTGWLSPSWAFYVNDFYVRQGAPVADGDGVGLSDELHVHGWLDETLPWAGAGDAILIEAFWAISQREVQWPSPVPAISIPDGATDPGDSKILVAFDATVETFLKTGLTNVTWTDITDDVRRFETERGRQLELDRVEAGTAVLTLENRDGQYDPTNIAGPHYGKIRPGTPVRIFSQIPTSFWSDGWGVYTGFVERWEFRRQGPRDGEVDVSLVDGFGLLADAQLDIRSSNFAFHRNKPDASIRMRPQPVVNRLQEILADVNWPPWWARMQFKGHVDVQRVEYANGANALTALHDAADAELPVNALIFIGGDGAFRFIGREDRKDSNTAFWELSDADGLESSAGASALPIKDLQTAISKEDIINVCIAYPADLPAASIPNMIVEDAASIAKYGRRVRDFPDLLVLRANSTPRRTGKAECQLYGQYIVQNYREPHVRVQRCLVSSMFDGDVRGDVDYFIRNVEIGHRLTIYTKPPGRPAVDALDFFVEGIRIAGDAQHRGDPIALEMELDLSPVLQWTWLDALNTS